MLSRVFLNNGIEIAIDAADDQLSQIEAFGSYLRRAPELKALRDGYRMLFGWSLLTFKFESENVCRVHEPDYRGDVTRLKPTIETTLRVISEQLAVAQRLNVEPLVAAYDAKVVFAAEAMEASDFYLERLPSAAGDGDWYVGLLDGESQGELMACRVFELLRRKPAIVPYLALPSGFLLVFKNGSLDAVMDGNNVDFTSRLA